METKKHRAGGSKGGNAYGSYQVRYASDKQKDFIKKLLEKKQHNLAIDLDTLNVQGAGDVITNLLLLPDKVGYVDYASEKQVSFAQSLVESKENGLEVLTDLLQKNNVLSLDKLDKQQVSLLITTLKNSGDKKPTIVDVGAYLYEGVVYSIRKNQTSGRFVIYTFNDMSKKYQADYSATKKLLSKIQPSHRLSLEEAEKYSAHTGLCCHCGRNLTALKSVASGIGQVCAKYYLSKGLRAEGKGY